MLKILVDSGSNLSKEMLNQYNIDYLPFCVTYKGKQYLSSLEWEYYSPEDLYNSMKEGEKPEVSRPSIGLWIEIIKKYLDYDILFISISKPLSGGYSTFNIIKNMIKSSNRLESICLSSAGAGAELAILKIVQKQKEGYSLDQLLDYGNYLNKKIQFFSFSESLKQWSFSGRDSNYRSICYPSGMPLLKADNETGDIKSIGFYQSIKDIFNTLSCLINQPITECVFSYSFGTKKDWIYKTEFFIKNTLKCSTYIKSIDCPSIMCTEGINSINAAFL